MAMHVISKRRITEFCVKHPEAAEALARWHQVVRHATWDSFADARATFNSVDLYQRCHIFNVGGNKYRIIAAVHYNTHKVFLRHVLTHDEYDKGKWKPECEPEKEKE